MAAKRHKIGIGEAIGIGFFAFVAFLVYSYWQYAGPWKAIGPVRTFDTSGWPVLEGFAWRHGCGTDSIYLGDGRYAVALDLRTWYATKPVLRELDSTYALFRVSDDARIGDECTGFVLPHLELRGGFPFAGFRWEFRWAHFGTYRVFYTDHGARRVLLEQKVINKSYLPHAIDLLRFDPCRQIVVAHVWDDALSKRSLWIFPAVRNWRYAGPVGEGGPFGAIQIEGASGVYFRDAMGRIDSAGCGWGHCIGGVGRSEGPDPAVPVTVFELHKSPQWPVEIYWRSRLRTHALLDVVTILPPPLRPGQKPYEVKLNNDTRCTAMADADFAGDGRIVGWRIDCKPSKKRCELSVTPIQ